MIGSFRATLVEMGEKDSISDYPIVNHFSPGREGELEIRVRLFSRSYSQENIRKILDALVAAGLKDER